LFLTFLKQIQYFFFFKNLQPLEAVAVLVSFPTNVHKLQSAKEIPRYGRFSEKGEKQVKFES